MHRAGSAKERLMAPTSKLPDQKATLSNIPKAGALYFLLVFAVGFVLGPIRELWAVPRFGPRMAELMEMPIMLIAIIFAARWTDRRLAVPPRPWIRLSVGATALGLLLLAELGVVFWLRGLSLGEYVAGRDPVSGTVYVVMLLVFAVMPLLVLRRTSS